MEQPMLEVAANCAWCEKGFIPKHPTRRYCSQRCKSAQANRLQVIIRENPEATPEEITRKLEELRQQWREVELYGAPCIVCGKKFDRHSFGKHRLMCSEECRRARARQHSRDYYRDVMSHRVGYRHRLRMEAKAKAQAAGVLDRECALCATVFTAAENTSRIYCSRKCLQAVTASGVRAKALPEIRECKWCGIQFKPTRFAHYTCSLECSWKRRDQRATQLSDSAGLGDSEEYHEFCRRLREEYAAFLEEREQKQEERRRARAEKKRAEKERELKRRAHEEAKRKDKEMDKDKAREKALRDEEPWLIDYSLMPLNLVLRSARRADIGQWARDYLCSPEGTQRLKAAGVRIKKA